MLFLVDRGNHPELAYRGGQESIVHLEADLREVVEWADRNGRRWAFTLSNAGSTYFEDRCRLDQLDEINWDAVEATRWSGRGISGTVNEAKQAEFLIERELSWELVERVGVVSQSTGKRALQSLGTNVRPQVVIRPDWYY
jgi:hypothetical protein